MDVPQEGARGLKASDIYQALGELDDQARRRVLTSLSKEELDIFLNIIEKSPLARLTGSDYKVAKKLLIQKGFVAQRTQGASKTPSLAQRIANLVKGFTTLGKKQRHVETELNRQIVDQQLM